MKISIMLLLSFFCSNLVAEPKISEELIQKTSSQEISALVSISEKRFKKTVESVEYIQHDSPPVGNAAAIVHFIPEKKSETVYIFPKAFFHYLPWSKDNPLPKDKKKIILGNWASNGELHKDNKYKFILANHIYYISFAKNVKYEEALELLKSIASHNYNIEFEETGHLEWDKELKAISTKGLEELKQKLKVDFIFYLTMGDILKTKSETKGYRITVDVHNPEDGLSMWTFSKKGNKYILIAMARYFI
ncbi:hypothetical protein DOJK_02205 [Patescibacteria group bacterium]|nr:hypothetical protein DOJK_02205 [Patescibacteria group bacterium]